jgi:hypothetical protein
MVMAAPSVVALTGVSIHCRSFCSNCAQPCTLYPEEAQQPAPECQPSFPQYVFPSCRHIDTTTSFASFQTRAPLFIHTKLHVPRTEDIIPKHGFASGLFGRRTRSFGSGGRGRCVTDCTALPCGLGTILMSLKGIGGSSGG